MIKAINTIAKLKPDRLENRLNSLTKHVFRIKLVCNQLKLDILRLSAVAHLKFVFYLPTYHFPCTHRWRTIFHFL